jgi:mycobactin salicyl-AMP ligase
MSALVRTVEEPAERPYAPVRWGPMRLSALLAATAGRHPQHIAFRDQPNRESWSGRPRLEWRYSLAARITQRLARFFSSLGLKPESAIGICLAGGSEAALTILAVELAGFRPCLLPIAWSQEALEAPSPQRGSRRL